MSSVLIVGASRGIGLEMARQYRTSGAQVFATYRKAEDAAQLKDLGAQALALDVLDDQAVGSFAQQISQQKLNIVVINAGIFGPRSAGIAAVTAQDFDAVMRTNVRAPMSLIVSLAPTLVASHGKLAVISSRMGSISLMNSASSWLYRSSKAALNAALKAASVELGPQGVVCMAFHPGWVRTDMGGSSADIDVATSVSGIRRVIAAANDSHNGKFLNYTGEQFDW